MIYTRQNQVKSWSGGRGGWRTGVTPGSRQALVPAGSPYPLGQPAGSPSLLPSSSRYASASAGPGSRPSSSRSRFRLV